MDVAGVVDAFRNEARTLHWSGEELESLPFVTRRCGTAGDYSYVTAFALTTENADAEIQEQISHFRELGRSFEWKTFSFDEPSNLVERLKAAGFEVEDLESLVMYDLADGLEPFQFPAGIEVKRVQNEGELTDFRSVAEEVFAKDYSFTTNQLAEAIASGTRGHDAYVAYVSGEPVSIGRLYTSPNSAFAGFYGGGTREAFHGQGIYRAIVAARAHEALALGARYLQVDALPTSLPILKRLGFTHIADTIPCVWSPPK